MLADLMNTNTDDKLGHLWKEALASTRPPVSDAMVQKLLRPHGPPPSQRPWRFVVVRKRQPSPNLLCPAQRSNDRRCGAGHSCCVTAGGPHQQLAICSKTPRGY